MREALCAVMGGRTDDIEMMKQRISRPAHRVSLDALAEHCVMRMAEKVGKPAGDCLQLA